MISSRLSTESILLAWHKGALSNFLHTASALLAGVSPRANRTSDDVPEFKGLAKEPTIDDPFSTTTSTNYAYTTKALQLCCHDTTS